MEVLQALGWQRRGSAEWGGCGSGGMRSRSVRAVCWESRGRQPAPGRSGAAAVCCSGVELQAPNVGLDVGSGDVSTVGRDG